MDDYIYRLRPAHALLDGYHELENQEIYFASPRELNDPMEGYKDIFWRGDAIVWTNFLRHYLLCLMEAVLFVIKNGPDRVFAEGEIFTFQTGDVLSPSDAVTYHDICDRFFHNDEVAKLPSFLEARISSMRRNELFCTLSFLHFYAFKTVCTGISPNGPLCDPDEYLRLREDPPFRFQEFFDTQGRVDQQYGASTAITEQMTRQAINALAQCNLIRAYTGAARNHGPAWDAIYSGFPERYIRQLEKLLYNDWYAACCIFNPANAAMWGNYGDAHRGVCLKFKTHKNTAGVQSIVLWQKTGISSVRGVLKDIYGEVFHELTKVTYQERFVEIDFFRSLGNLTGEQLGFWFSDGDGKVSATGLDLVTGAKSWRSEYWDNHQRMMTTKLPDWEHEDEFRLVLSGLTIDFSNKADRKLKYRFEDLDGVIFGMNTPLEDKLAIMRIIESKCIEKGRKDFDFYQATYSSVKGSIEIVKLDLIKLSSSGFGFFSPGSTPSV
jgi:hypothetical protein